MAGYAPYLAAAARRRQCARHEDWVRPCCISFETFRILCAVRDGEWGVAGLNEAIEQRLDGAGTCCAGGEWYVGRPVMVTRNDYGTGVFNGDIGLTLPDPARAGVAARLLPGRRRTCAACWPRACAMSRRRLR